MAYFEYGYVNTGYDTSSALPPSTDLQSTCTFKYHILDVIHESICEFNYDIDEISNSICEFNYDIEDPLASVEYEKVVEFNYNVYGDYYSRLVTFPYNIEVAFLQSKVDLNYDIDLPIFLTAECEMIYNIGDKPPEASLRILRKDEDD